MPNDLLVIRNETSYDTRDIRAAVLACEKYLDLTDGRTVTVVYSRRECVSGYAYYPRSYQREGDRVKLRLPRPKKRALDESLTRDFLWLVEHELAHSRGKSHKDIRGSLTNTVHGLERRPTWGEGLQLRMKPVKAKPTSLERIAKRALKVERDLARWERKLKLAKTKVAKLRLKQRYYARQVCALPHATSPLYQGLHQLDAQTAETTLMAACPAAKE